MGVQADWKKKFAARKGGSSSGSSSSGGSSGGGQSSKTTNKTLKVKGKPNNTVSAPSPRSGTVIVSGQGYSTMYPESYTKQLKAINEAKTYYSGGEVAIYGGAGKSVKSLKSSSKSVQTNKGTNSFLDRVKKYYSGADKFLSGWLPGGVTPLESYSDKVSDILNLPQSIWSDYREKKADTLTGDVETEKRLAELERELQIAKEMQDLYNKNWLENFGIGLDPFEKQVQEGLREQAYNISLSPGGSSPINPLSLSGGSSDSFIDRANTIGKWALIGIGGLVVYNLTKRRGK